MNSKPHPQQGLALDVIARGLRHLREHGGEIGLYELNSILHLDLGREAYERLAEIMQMSINGPKE